ncbi:MAG: GIY-YIG nuclease family protein [Pseudomonadota bacterium]
MVLIDFTELIEKHGYDPRECTLLRHDARGSAAWAAGPSQFDSFVSYQKRNPSPYRKRPVAFQFIAAEPMPDGSATALFAAAHRIIDRFDYPSEGRLPVLHHPEFGDEDDGVLVEAFDLERLPEWDALAGRIVIRWGTGTRSWSQLPERQHKEVIELRRDRHEPGFPGFSAFRSQVSAVLALPSSWRSALSSVSGVYLLVCTDSGEQYVGSAYGEAGFWGRWSGYAKDGHGGNLLLKARGAHDYTISILEVASPDMSPGDIIRREGAWKSKLGTRAHGLNLN